MPSRKPVWILSNFILILSNVTVHTSFPSLGVSSFFQLSSAAGCQGIPWRQTLGSVHTLLRRAPLHLAYLLLRISAGNPCCDMLYWLWLTICMSTALVLGRGKIQRWDPHVLAWCLVLLGRRASWPDREKHLLETPLLLFFASPSCVETPQNMARALL